MEVLYSFINIPFILIIGVIVFILVLSNIHNKKLKIDLISSISISVIIMFASLFMMITFPPMIIIIIITIIVWITIQLFISFRNKLILLRNNKKEIYIRDIEVDYSPAVLFYLINNKLETKVVLPATILNLCANKIIKLEENQEGYINIIDLKNKDLVNKLSDDEKYAYEMITNGINSSTLIEWQEKVQKEYYKYKFSKKHTTPLRIYFNYIYVIIIAVLFAVSLLNNIEDGGWNFVLYIMGFVSFTIVPIIEITNNRKKKKKKSTQFKDTYTRKGAIELNKWKKFENFIKDFTLVNEKEYKSIIILGKYLSYSIVLGLNNKCDQELLRKINAEYLFDFRRILNKFRKYI